MIKIIVGHRGVGKSELVKRWKLYLSDRDADFIDLDDEIEKKIGRTIPELFLEHGEDYFRELERQQLIEFLQRADGGREIYLCLGAGFDLTVLPDTVEILWVRRRTDDDGRIFLNRPRLNPEISPLAEFKKRALVREEFYRSKATEIYTLPEGEFEYKIRAQVLEKAILQRQLIDIGGVLTVLSSHLDRPIRWKSFLNRYAGRGILFELRNDLLNGEQLALALSGLEGERRLYSFRNHFECQDLPACDYYDWPLDQKEPDEFFAVVAREKRILSWHSHEATESFAEIMTKLSRFEDSCAQLKFSPFVGSFEQLKILWDWQSEKPAARNLLPRSADGRWSWARRLLKGRQLLNFWREGEGSAPDQPTLFEWLASPSAAPRFAAVLGDPVHHSFTPIEHLDYFSKLEAPVLAIDIHRDEWSAAVDLLRERGLRWAAVTAPLKADAAALAGGELSAVNTLFFDEKKKIWRGTSTDEAGFQELIEGIGVLAPLQSQICVWGGGGTLDMLKQNLPLAQLASSRTGESRNPEKPLDPPQVLIWAAPRTPETKMPPVDWKPALVVDLNYKEDSLGREYAQLTGANYQSGLRMFQVQAQQQRMYWSRINEPQTAENQ